MRVFLGLILFLNISILAKEYENLHINILDNSNYITNKLEEKDLLKVIGVKYPPFYKFWKPNPTFKLSQIDDFKNKLEEYYQSLGFYSVDISSKTNDSSIILNIDKKDVVVINSIDIDDEFKDIILFKVGDNFNSSSFKSSKSLIERYLQESGYPKYEIKSKAYVKREEKLVDIVFDIDKKEQIFFGETKIDGNNRIRRNVLDKSITYKEGELFDIKKIEDTYNNIYYYGVHDYIVVEPNLDTKNSKSPVLISLVEGDNKIFKTFLGYSSDDGVRGGVSWEDKNFNGNLKNFEIGTKISQIGYEAYNRFYDPYVDGKFLGDLSFENRFNIEENWYDSYDEKKIENVTTFGREIFGLNHYFGFMIEQSSIESNIASLSDGNYLINSLFYNFLIDKRDSKLDARDGYMASFYMEASDSSLGSDLDYLKSLIEFRKIETIAQNFTTAFKGRVGTVSAKVPIFKNFFTGGSLTNRGYGFQDLGRSDIEGNPYGGITLVDFMFELRYYIDNKFQLATFYDTSMLSEDTYEFNDKFYGSYGFGLRYSTPIGPLRVDIGYPQDLDSYEIQITIGQAF